MTKDQLKHALISIAVGAVVSAITVFLQGILDLLQNIPAEIPASFAAMAKYLAAVKIGKFNV